MIIDPENKKDPCCAGCGSYPCVDYLDRSIGGPCPTIPGIQSATYSGLHAINDAIEAQISGLRRKQGMVRDRAVQIRQARRADETEDRKAGF
jgi:hypothetical protein